MGDWWPDLSGSDKPRYLAIADAIAEDIRNGRLAPSDRLPPQRSLRAGSISISPPSRAAMWRRRSAG
jgi:DNA-binding transcriptional MocR family regulator